MTKSIMFKLNRKHLHCLLDGLNLLIDSHYYDRMQDLVEQKVLNELISRLEGEITKEEKI